MSFVEKGLGADIAERLLAGERRLEYEGCIFEHVCLEWLLRKARAKELPIQPTLAGSWWGTDPVARESVDIDVVAFDDIDKKALVGECKWRNDFNETEALQKLADLSRLLRGYEVSSLYLFTKLPLSPSVQAKEKEDPRLHLVTIEDRYK